MVGFCVNGAERSGSVKCYLISRHICHFKQFPFEQCNHDDNVTGHVTYSRVRNDQTASQCEFIFFTVMARFPQSRQ